MGKESVRSVGLMYHKTRICKDCNKDIEYNSYYAYHMANKKNCSCRPCGNIKMGKAHSGKKVSDSTRKKMSEAKSGANSPHWKGGVYTTSSGYRKIYQGPNKQYKLEHRIIFEKYLGRELLSTEVVHHENEIRNDNRIENLILFNNNTDHRKWHCGNKTVSHIKGYDLK